MSLIRWNPLDDLDDLFGRFPRSLNRRQQQRDQNPDDRNHHEQLKQAEACLWFYSSIKRIKYEIHTF